MKAGSLFSGIGGLDLGLERAGVEIVWQCEIDQNAQAVLRRHWPNTPIYDDVTQLKGGDLAPIDILCGGFPCQDLSMAGRRAGLAGEKSGLFFDFMRLAAECGPAWVLIENVPGLLSSNNGRDLGTVFRALGELGYWWSWRVLDSQYFRVPQRRRRVFIIGNNRNRTAAARVLFEPDICAFDAKASRRARKANAKIVSQSFSEDSGRERAGFRRVEVFSAVDSFTNRVRIYHDIAPTLVCGNRKPDKGHPFLVVKHNDDDIVMRGFTPLECERLQGFPDHWTEGQADTVRYLQLRNAVCVPVAEWIGKRIVEVEANLNERKGSNGKHSRQASTTRGAE